MTHITSTALIVGNNNVLLALMQDAVEDLIPGAPEKYVLKYIQLNMVATVAPASAQVSRYVLMLADSNTGPVFTDPAVITTYSQQRVLHTGQIYAAPAASTPLFNGYADGVRSLKTKARTSSRDGLYMGVAVSVAFTLSVVARCYLTRVP